LVDCSIRYGNHGCGGGFPDFAYEYTKDFGNVSEYNYEYTAKDGKCKYDESAATFFNN
jgi:hypothetical protein